MYHKTIDVIRDRNNVTCCDYVRSDILKQIIAMLTMIVYIAVINETMYIDIV